MIEVRGDLFSPPAGVEAICITTNGQCDRYGNAVMGRGVALEARKRWPLIARVLGARLAAGGNTPAILTVRDGDALLLEHTTVRVPFHILTLPTKRLWRENSSITLIRRSLERLRALAEQHALTQVALPRPGCQNGGLTWDAVRPVVEELLPGPIWLAIHPEAP